MSMIKKWEIIKEEDISPSKWFPLWRHIVKLPNGKIVDDYYVSKFGEVSMVLAFTKNKEVVFVRQYKHGVREITIELPAGMRKEKTPIEAAHCELKEEAGILAKDLIFFGKLFLAPSKDGTITNLFMTANAEITQGQELDENEEIEVLLVPIDEIDVKISSGEIMSADTIAALTLAKLKMPEYFSK